MTLRRTDKPRPKWPFGLDRNRPHGIRRKRIIEALKARDWMGLGVVCCWCRQPLKTGEITLEHVKPIAKGGNNEKENLRMACFPCNLARGASGGAK